MTSMNRVVAVTLGASVLSGGLVLASNMGFKIVHALKAADGVESRTGVNSIALPYIPKSGLDDASDLIQDIGPGSVVQIARYLRASDSWDPYIGTAGTAFLLQPGEGYLVQVSGDVEYRIVGSHDPAAMVTFFASDGGVTSRSGNNLYAPPFHSTARTAAELRQEIGPDVVVQVARYLRTSDSWDSYTGTSGADFPLVRGEAYLVQVSQTVNYTPAHY